MRITVHHSFYYFFELLILLTGFAAVSFASSFHTQLIILFLLLASYTGIGILHHRLHHTVKAKIVIEYILISAIIFATFLFLNTNKI